MLKSLKVENFKSIVDKDICLKNLNVLTGLNGSGKSSILQILALLKQSINNNERFNEGLIIAHTKKKCVD